MRPPFQTEALNGEPNSAGVFESLGESEAKPSERVAKRVSIADSHYSVSERKSYKIGLYNAKTPDDLSFGVSLTPGYNMFVPVWFSSPGRTRTYDPAVNSRLLYQLSYRGLWWGKNARC